MKLDPMGSVFNCSRMRREIQPRPGRIPRRIDIGCRVGAGRDEILERDIATCYPLQELPIEIIEPGLDAGPSLIDSVVASSAADRLITGAGMRSAEFSWAQCVQIRIRMGRARLKRGIAYRGPRRAWKNRPALNIVKIVQPLLLASIAEDLAVSLPLLGALACVPKSCR